MSKIVLPQGWLKAKLSDVIQPRGEKVSPVGCDHMQFLGMDHVEAQTTKIIGSVSASSMKSSAARFYSGDVLYGRLRPYLNKVAQPNFDGLASAEFIVFPDTKLISSQFLKFRLNAEDFVSFASHLNEGDRPRVSFEQIGDFEISVPPPPEQHRIIAKIEELFSELDKGIENLKTARAQLKVYRQALLKHAFEGKLTAQWRKDNLHTLETAGALLKRIQQERAQRYQQQIKSPSVPLLQRGKTTSSAPSAHPPLKKGGRGDLKPKAPKSLRPLTAEELAELPELPEGWGWVRLGELTSIIAGNAFEKAEYSDSGVRLLQIANVSFGEIVWDKVVHLPEKYWDEYSELRLFAGDLIMALNRPLLGDDLKIGRLGLADTPSILYQRIGKFVPHNEGVSNLIYWYLRSSYFISSLKKELRGVNIPFINQTRLMEYPVPLFDFDELAQLVAELQSRFSVVDQLDQTITTSLQQAEALRQSILKKAFSGQLVAQDANDEPASVLLDRIKAEKAARVVTAKPRKPQKVQTQSVPAKPNVILFPVKIGNISATDLHAGIIAMAYRRHEQSPKFLQHFHHVKAEKISHLVEAHLGIDLERVPFKDVAGPNDYLHLRKVESRARKANWFDVHQQKNDGAYVFTKKHSFDALLDRTATALGERVAEVDALLELLLPLNTRQTEIVATLYAAWNNLLLLGHSPQDEDIVYEARENWHESKLKIDREKFFKALEWMRREGLVPVGKGRYVGVKVKRKTTRKPV